MKLNLESSREQARGEEFANSISHAIGLIAVLVGTPFLIISAIQHGEEGLVIGSCIFVVTAIILYLSSTVYHALPAGKAKRLFRTIEHSAIFLLIAGTYTPFTLGVLKGTWGLIIFGLVWGLAIIGVVMKALQKMSHPIFSTSLYLLMGWLIIMAINPLLAKLPGASFLWLLAGGLSYSVGVIFFATDSKLRYGHFLWHLFVMGGTTCHYFSILWYTL
ncbi:PAQR family membrane homeostasis protein TrhA [Methylophaga sp.]|uniref:PAQR family membrane homeostasis protein TrhA n=1 Tax=Methylophaga sp. TaxID=2024840 RepID=UPI003F6A5295